MIRTDRKNGSGDRSVASVCREMRETAEAEERQGLFDLRNLATDSLRGWADIIEETSENAKIDEDTSDGYHTFRELYRYRMLYNAGFFNMLARHTDIPVVKSHRHGDGEPCFGGGWFIVSAQLPTGQVSNHYEDRFWELFDVPEVEKAPEWDGHTPNDAADRIEAFLKTCRPEKPESGGDAAAMREALVQCELFLGNVSRHGHPTLNPGDKRTACVGVDELREMVVRALSAPADSGTVPGKPVNPEAMGKMKTTGTTESKECYGDHFKCDECGIVKPGWKSACKRQCEYNWEHRNSHTARPCHDDDDGWDIAGQYQTIY